jgi:AraC family transcriptional regulator of adaptative response/methylated-DNA-[protein]-cysteine methyltransferase
MTHVTHTIADSPVSRRSLPPAARMYRALAERDRSFDGAFVAAVRTTGVFCRPGCGARTPRRENVEFFARSDEALRAGYRPCRRCRPLELAGSPPPWVERALRLLERSERRVDSSALRAEGIDPSRAARWFKEHYGMTFQAYQRARRVGDALRPLSAGEQVGSVALSAGFESESGFREAFEKLFGASPTHAARGADVARVQWVPSPVGPLLLAAHDSALCLLEFADRRSLAAQIEQLKRRIGRPIAPGANAVLEQAKRELAEYFAGERQRFEVALDAPGTPFEERVWTALRAIPYGATASYADVARGIGSPSAVRAVARANGRNRIAIAIPCHRVIGSDGSLTGYGGGLWRKQALLELEREHAESAPL